MAPLVRRSNYYFIDKFINVVIWNQIKTWCMRRSHWGVISIPYIWLLLFFLIPFVIVAKISVATQVISIPPFSDLFVYSDGAIGIDLNFENYWLLFEQSIYISSYFNAIRIAFFSTVIALLIGYPLAYIIAGMEARQRNIFLFLIILPSWTSFLIRIYAWIGILKNNGLINNALFALNLTTPDQPIQLLHTEFAVYLGIVYAYLPFMILPLYAVLEKQDPRLLQAATDLGAGPLTAFWRITLPLSMPGVVAGCMLVFIPAVGEFVIPALLGGSDVAMIGKVLWQEFFNNRDWPVASALAIVMLLIILAPIVWFHHNQSKKIDEELRT